MTEKKKRPLIGGAGLLLLLIGCILRTTMSGTAWWVPLGVVILGALLLAYALFTGNLTFFG